MTVICNCLPTIADLVSSYYNKFNEKLGGIILSDIKALPEQKSPVDYFLKIKGTLDSLIICEFLDDQVKIKANSNPRTTRARTIKIPILIEMAKGILSGLSTKQIGKNHKIEGRIVWEWMTVNLPQLCAIYPKQQEIAEVCRGHGINSHEEMCDLYNKVRYVLEYKNVKKDKVDNIVATERLKEGMYKAAELAGSVMENGGIKQAAENLKTNRNRIYNSIDSYLPKTYSNKLKEVSFKYRTAEIQRVINSCKYFIYGNNFAEISRFDDITTSPGDVMKDIIRRSVDLYKIYPKSKFIQEQLSKYGISSYEEMKNFVNEIKSAIKMWEETTFSEKRISERNKLILEIADFTIEQDQKGLLLSDAEIGKRYGRAGRTVAIYLKGILFWVDEERYDKVISIFEKREKSSGKLNSYNNSIS